MKRERVKQVRCFEATSIGLLQANLNESMRDLADQSPVMSDIRKDDGKYWATITYEDTLEEWDSVADEFHADGIVFLCRNCPLHDDVKDRRVRHAGCKHSPTGRCHLDKEACEYFYKLVRQNEVEVVE